MGSNESGGFSYALKKPNSINLVWVRSLLGIYRVETWYHLFYGVNGTCTNSDVVSDVFLLIVNSHQNVKTPQTICIVGNHILWGKLMLNYRRDEGDYAPRRYNLQHQIIFTQVIINDIAGQR